MLLSWNLKIVFMWVRLILYLKIYLKVFNDGMFKYWVDYLLKIIKSEYIF